METIAFRRNETAEDMLSLAIAKGYKTKVMVELTQEMNIVEAEEQSLPIQSIIDDNKCIAVTGEEEVLNSETPKDFLAIVYQKMIDDDIESTMVDAADKELKRKYQMEKEALAKTIHDNIGHTDIIPD